MSQVRSCDTAVAVGTATVDGSVIFAKNSDRQANECQPLFHAPRAEHGGNAVVQCQYIEIPQVETTWEVIGSRPHWLWGFEMGVNEWGVTIGNEAVFSREPDEEVALIGMDLVRLGLERSRTADEAVSVIGELVERYGQGGSCEATHFETYHNSFIVADPQGAWILETAGHRWFARRVRDVAAISNMFTIEGEWDAASPGIADYAREQGWGGEPFSLAAAYARPDAEILTSICRLDRARALLAGGTTITADHMRSQIRDHGDGGIPEGDRPLPTICMHNAPNWNGETAASLVTVLRPDRPRELAVTAWVSFGSPCLGIFRPVYPFAAGLPPEVERGGAEYDQDSPWWVFERLHRAVSRAPSVAELVQGPFGALEARFVEEAAAAEETAARQLHAGDRDGAIATLRAVVEDTTRRALDLARSLTPGVEAASATAEAPGVADMWRKLDRAVGLERARAAGVPVA